MFTEREQVVKRNLHYECDDGAGASEHTAGMAKTPKKQKPGPFGRNLLDRRKRFDMTQDSLSEKARVSKSYISSLESGARANPSEGIARRIADVFQCDVSDLWGRDQSSFEARAMELLRAMPEDRREAAIGALYGLAASAGELRHKA